MYAPKRISTQNTKVSQGTWNYTTTLWHLTINLKSVSKWVSHETILNFHMTCIVTVAVEFLISGLNPIPLSTRVDRLPTFKSTKIPSHSAPCFICVSETCCKRVAVESSFDDEQKKCSLRAIGFFGRNRQRINNTTLHKCSKFCVSIPLFLLQ